MGIPGFRPFLISRTLISLFLLIMKAKISSSITNLTSGALPAQLAFFLPTGCNPYINDPYDRGDDEDVDVHYSEIASSIQLGCSKLFNQLPALIS